MTITGRQECGTNLSCQSQPTAFPPTAPQRALSTNNTTGFSEEETAMGQPSMQPQE